MGILKGGAGGGEHLFLLFGVRVTGMGHSFF